jgi:hypothetical protein
MSVIVIQFDSSQVNAHITCQIASARSAEKVSSSDIFQATTRLEEEVGRRGLWKEEPWGIVET